jgi:predicted RNA binding protein YcfA (HicA-like mRNA interferase family)
MAGILSGLLAATGSIIISNKIGTATIAGHPGQDMKPGTYNNILKQAGPK